MLENSQAAHLNFAYIPVYSIPITGYRAPLHRHFQALKDQPDGGTPTRQWAGHPDLPPHGAHHTLYARKFQGCAPELHIYPPIASTLPHFIAISKPLKPNPTGLHLLGSGQDTRAYLPMGLTTPCMLENSQAAHLNFAYIPVYSIPITGYRAPLHRHF